ncbi:MAG: hypothetical protein SWQ30_06635 [Thermodesulfobacteriota bacterium]|nr:hypothetical protein [Thermodesulfobacteriota bacterium]
MPETMDALKPIVALDFLSELLKQCEANKSLPNYNGALSYLIGLITADINRIVTGEEEGVRE